jgi:hypothetical protein
MWQHVVCVCVCFALYSLQGGTYRSVSNVTVSLLLSANSHSTITAQCPMSQYLYCSVSNVTRSLLLSVSLVPQYHCRLILSVSHYNCYSALRFPRIIIAICKRCKCRSCLALRSSQYKYFSMSACHNIATAKKDS